MNIFKILIILLFSACSFQSILCQGRYSLGFYNVENFYDTIPSLFYDDSDYTPQGRFGWSDDRYANKLNNIAKVIGEMDLDILGLAEVENEEVVRDVVTTISSGYNYIHRTSGDARGMDLVLLYKGDRFVPDNIQEIRSGTTRGFLYIRGKLGGKRIDIILCHLPSQLNSRSYRQKAMDALSLFVGQLQSSDPESRVIVMGDFNTDPSERLWGRLTGPRNNNNEPHIFSPFSSFSSSGMGTYVYNNRWRLYDNIFLSDRFRSGDILYHECGIFIRPYLIAEGNSVRRGYPLRTFSGNIYNSGYSDHLPVFTFIEIQ